MDRNSRSGAHLQCGIDGGTLLVRVKPPHSERFRPITASIDGRRRSTPSVMNALLRAHAPPADSSCPSRKPFAWLLRFRRKRD